MSLTLTKGFKKPETGDRNWYADLELDIQKTNDHVHNGTDSQALNPYDLNIQTQTILAASWAAVAGQAGTFKQTLTCPTGWTFDKMQVRFFINGGGQDGHEVALSIRKVGASSFDIFINDNSLELKAVYA